jgi:hypothetical protein
MSFTHCMECGDRVVELVRELANHPRKRIG